ncbi:MAG: HNH endonuclease [Deltaproteobacteria bacterium]|nr:HNH endonuclease [Deltaproteobacteria bacterium]
MKALDTPFFIPAALDSAEIRREKEKARALRRSQWWQRKISQGICHYCGRHVPPGELTMDHIVPLVRGGKSSRGNLAAACKDCNNRKKYLLPTEWNDYMRILARVDQDAVLHPGGNLEE